MSRSRNYCYTLNNYTTEEVEGLQALECVYHIMGKEVGESGTPHIQGAIRFKTMKSLKQLKVLIPRAHLEILKGTINQASDYCKKEGDYKEFGLIPMQNPTRAQRNKRLRDATLNELVESGEINIKEVRALKNARMDLLQENSGYSHNSVRGIWYYGPPGTGKSRKAREEHPNAFIKSQNKWFCGYAGEKTIILDDLDSNVLGHHLKIWADRYACTGEVKGGTVNLQHELFIITSNYHPDMLWPDDPVMGEAIKRRFRITHFNNPLQ